jgi:acetolactate synthase-1/2/3 large subunit
VKVIGENGQFGAIVWKQEKKFGPLRHRLQHPDFVKPAEGYGVPAWRCGSAEEFGERLGHA